jgi:hypothetical protein
MEEDGLDEPGKQHQVFQYRMCDVQIVVPRRPYSVCGGLKADAAVLNLTS